MKILCVEDGSVDMNELEDLQDGKVLVYRQGAKPPYILDFDDINLQDHDKEVRKQICEEIKEKIDDVIKTNTRPIMRNGYLISQELVNIIIDQIENKE